MALRALIFDVDGTLAETEELHRQAFNQAFAARALATTWPDPQRQWNWDQENYRKLLTVTGGKERIAAYLGDWLGIAPDTHKEQIAAIHADKTLRFAELLALGRLTLRPGVSELISQARQMGLQLAIATTTSRSNVDVLARIAFSSEADAIFDVISCGDEVAEKKPAPDVYQLALERLCMEPAECWAFEDSHNGLRSAKAAGLRCVVTPSAYTTHEDLSSADILVECLDDIRLSSLAGAP